MQKKAIGDHIDIGKSCLSFVFIVFARLGFYLLFSALFLQTHAQISDPEQLQQMYTSAGDLGEMSLKLLNGITGEMRELQMITSLPATPLGKINSVFFSVFTYGVFAFVGIAAGYTVVMGTIGTAYEGETLGKKLGRDRSFLFFRTMTSVILFLPLPTGYSGVQVMLNNITIQGVALGNATWKAIATAMLTYQGGIGNIIIGLGGLSQEFSLVQINSETQKTQVDSMSNMTTNLKKQLITDERNGLVSDGPYLMSLLSSSQCVLQYSNVVYDDGSSGAGTSLDTTDYYKRIDVILSKFQKQMRETGCKEQGDCVLDYQYDSKSKDCGKYDVVIDDETQYGGTISDMLLQTARQISTQAVSFYVPNLKYIAGLCDGQNCLTTDLQNQIGRTMYALGDTWVSQTQYYARSDWFIKNAATGSEDSSGEITGTLSDLLNGGWAMAAPNYMYYSKRMGSSNQAAPSGAPTNNENIVKITVQDQNNDFKNFINDDGDVYITPLLGGGTPGGVAKEIQALITTNYTVSVPTSNNYMTTCESSADCMQKCAENFSQCKNFFDLIGGYKGDISNPGNFEAGKYTKYFYEKFKQINVNSVSTFDQLEANSGMCDIPFTQNGNCGTSISSTGPLKPEIAIPSAFALVIVTIALGLIPFFKPVATVGLLAVAAVSLPFAFMATANSVSTMVDIFIDPLKLYPKSLGMDVQTFAYFMSKAWIDVFGWNQVTLFTYPVQAIATYGALVMQYSVTFLIRIGTDTFNANMSSSFSYFINKMYMTLPLFIANTMSKVVGQYGDEWLLQPMPIMTVQWAQNVCARAGVCLPPFLFIIWILVIPIPIYLIIGAILKVIGFALRVAVTVAQIINMVAFHDFILQVQLFVNELYNPIYFAIAVPSVVLGATFAFMMPLYPVLIYSMSVLHWVIFYVEAILATPIILFGLANPKGQGLLGEAKQILMVMLVLFLKPFLTVLGFFCAQIVASFGILFYAQMALPVLNNQIGSWAASQDDSVAATMTIMGMIVFVYAYYQIITFSFAMIYKVPNAIFRWIGAGMAGEEDVEKMQAISEQFTSAVQEVAGSGKDVASGMGSAGSQFGASSAEKNFQGKYDQQKATEQDRKTDD
ncbi:MAG: hypothetical protein VX112_03320 [Pseudomonadota bacterium]|nr:hypothetical protein [Pseudomonadota bacterium]